MTECTDPEGHLFNKWAIEGGAVCSLCGEKLSLGETLAMLCEHAALKQEIERYKQGFIYTSENGRELLVRMWNDEPWIFYKHPDGQWVSLKKIALLTAEEQEGETDRIDQ